MYNSLLQIFVVQKKNVSLQIVLQRAMYCDFLQCKELLSKAILPDKDHTTRPKTLRFSLNN